MFWYYSIPFTPYRGYGIRATDANEPRHRAYMDVCMYVLFAQYVIAYFWYCMRSAAFKCCLPTSTTSEMNVIFSCLRYIALHTGGSSATSAPCACHGDGTTSLQYTSTQSHIPTSPRPNRCVRPQFSSSLHGTLVSEYHHGNTHTYLASQHSTAKAPKSGEHYPTYPRFATRQAATKAAFTMDKNSSMSCNMVRKFRQRGILGKLT